MGDRVGGSLVVGVEAEEQPADGVGVQCLRVAVVGDGAEEEVPANDAGDDGDRP